MPDRVVWLPLNSVGGGVSADTGATPGRLVRIAPAAEPEAVETAPEVES
jgi:NADH-quinone oxidoreductase subunit G